MQGAAVSFTLLTPIALWILTQKWRSPRIRFALRRALALALLMLAGWDFATKFALGETSLARGLPMQLCDWAVFVAAGALWFRWPVAFALAYFWGLAGTAQALLTPAIDPTVPWWRQFGFFFVHALIVVGVLHLLLTERLRPTARSLLRVVFWSECYLACALVTNALTGGNYGFLTHRPAQPSLLDYFSDTRWLYVLQINLAVFLLFGLLYLPWLIRDGCQSRPR